MSDGAQVDWGLLGGKPQNPKPPPAVKPVQQPAQPDWALLGGQKAQAPAQPDWGLLGKPKQREDDPGILLRPLSKTALGKSASDLYDKYVTGNVLPKEHQGDWGSRFMLELARGGPEMVDAASSPAGIGLIMAHLFPGTRPIAAVADTVLGAMQATRTVPSLWKLGHDFTPENAAIAAKDVFYTYGLIKGPQKMAEEQGLRAATSPRAKEALAKLESPEVRAKKTETKANRAAKQAKRDDIWDELMKPKTTFEKFTQKAYAGPLTGIAKILLPRPADVEMAAELVDRRRRNINEKMYAKKTFLEDMRKEVPKEDLAIDKMGYVIQGSATPDEVGLSPKGREWVGKYRKFNQATVDYMKQAYGDIKLTFQDADKYMAQIWDLDKMVEQGIMDDPKTHKRWDGVTRRMMRDPFMKARSAMQEGKDGPWSYKEAIEDWGWIPKYDNVADVINTRWNHLIQTTENQRMARTLSDIGGIVSETKGTKMGIPWPKATDATVLKKAAYRGKTAGVTMYERAPVFVHPAMEHAVNAVFGEGIKTRKDIGAGQTRMTFLGGLENIRAWGKQSATMTSMFHNWAEMSMSMAVQTGQGMPGKALKSIFVADPKYWKYLKGSIWEAFGKPVKDGNPTPLHMNPEATMQWIKDGVQFSSSDREEAVIKWMREFQGKNKITSAASPLVRAFGNVSYGFNKALWDYYIPGQMLNGAESIMTREMPRLGEKATPEAISGLRQEVAKHLNRVFGTESLESLLLHPKTRQLMSALFFAPVWTLSNIRQITSGYENEVQKRLRNKWAAGGAISWFLSTQLLNYATTSWFSRDKNGNHDWKGRFTWDNPGAPLKLFGREAAGLSDNALRINVGPNPDGSEGYVTLSKGMGEVFAWMLSPRREFLGKLSTPAKVGWTVAGGRAPGSDYPVIDYSKDKPDEVLVKSVGEILSLGTPFWAEDFKRMLERKLAPESVPEGVSTQIIGVGLPVTKGLTVTRATEAYQLAKDRGDTEVMRAILEAARRNKLRISTIVTNVRRNESQRRRTAAGPRNKVPLLERWGINPPARTAEPPELTQ